MFIFRAKLDLGIVKKAKIVDEVRFFGTIILLILILIFIFVFIC